MYNLRLSSEQLEIRDTVRDFVEREIKPVVLKAERLEGLERRLPMELLDQASQLGLRTLALSEERGGAGADALTSCIVTEELAAGDPDLAAALAETSALGRALFDQLMSQGQRDRFLPQFLKDDRYHLAHAAHEPGSYDALGVNYHRPAPADAPIATTAVRAGNVWVINGLKDCVANAPVARLIAVQARTGTKGVSTLLVPRETPGLSVREHDAAERWFHGSCGEVILEECCVPAENLLGQEVETTDGRGWFQALNLGIGRAAYEAARPGGAAHPRAPGDRGEARRDRDPPRGCARHRLAGRLGLGPSRGRCRPQSPRSAASGRRQGVYVGGDLSRGERRRRMLRRDGRDARHALAEIRSRRAHLPAFRTRQQRCEIENRRSFGRLSTPTRGIRPHR